MTDIILELKPHHYAIPGKSVSSGIGQAVDAAWKEVILELGGTPSPQFAPHDYRLDGKLHEIKSSEGTWLSIPNSELELGDSEIIAGRDVTYVIFLQLSRNKAKFLGYVPLSKFRHMIEPSIYETKRQLENGLWVSERAWRILLCDVKPFLT
jgi:hypothetical protein